MENKNQKRTGKSFSKNHRPDGAKKQYGSYGKDRKNTFDGEKKTDGVFSHSDNKPYKKTYKSAGDRKFTPKSGDRKFTPKGDFKNEKVYSTEKPDFMKKPTRQRTDSDSRKFTPKGGFKNERTYSAEKPTRQRTDSVGKKFTPKSGFKSEKVYSTGKPSFIKKSAKERRDFGERKTYGSDFAKTLSPEENGLIYGRNSVLELLKSDRQIDKIYVQTGRREGSITVIVAEAVRKSIPVVESDKLKLDKMAGSSAHQGVVAQTSDIEYCSVDDILTLAKEKNEKPFILVLDKITDPQNMGAIIRTAVCAGVHGIIIPKRHSAGISPLVNKISEGAALYIKVARVSNIQTAIEDLKEKGVWIFSSAAENKNNADRTAIYTSADYNVPLALVMGSEGDGITPIVVEKSDFLINIPLHGPIDSLNVSCAAAILIFEILNKRKSENEAKI